MRFIDEVEITTISGKGGNGCASFRREVFVPFGGPDGGDGGKGGDVVLYATSRRNTLEHLRGQKLYQATPGGPGQGAGRTGADGEDLVIELPVGTVVFDAETGQLLADLAEDERRVILCHGGQGGRGNTRFKTSTNRAPTRYDPGGPAHARDVRLELRLLADVGLLGFPNAGKSTLISAVSNARPRVADYPFTTLVPNLGVVSFGWEGSFVIADIPGLIEGASEGQGLGLRFLRHVERCTFFLHLVSCMDYGEDVPDPVRRYEIINNELRVFSPELAQRPQIVVLTKVDTLDEEAIEALRARFRDEAGVEVRAISAPLHQGTTELMQECWRRLAELRATLAEVDSPLR